jgi:N-acetylmuramoyl-L-alanine amidase
MRRWRLALACMLMMSACAWAQEWKLDRMPTPWWVQPGEELQVVLLGPAGKTASLSLGDRSAALRQLSGGGGRYVAHLRAPASGSTALRLTVGGASQQLATVEVRPGTCLFQATETVVTRQGPDADFERLTPLVRGAAVPVNGRRGDWYRSAASGAWLDGRSGKLSEQVIPSPQLTDILVEPLPNGDARLTLSCGSVPEAGVLVDRQRLQLRLSDTQDLMFELTKQAAAANFLGPITVRPEHRGSGRWDTLVEVALGPAGLGGYELRPGQRPGELVLQVRRPLPGSFQGLIIALDAGHGGPKDPGTVGHGGLPEKVLNLRVTEALAAMLKERGATVVMTRTSDSDVAATDRGAAHELQARVDLATAAGAHLFLSLHHNARPSVEEGKRSHGTDIYWYQPYSEPLARALANPIADAIGEPLRSSRFRSFHVIRQTWAPSVLVEFQYLSNSQLESSVLTQPDYPDKAARGVMKGLEAYLNRRP